MVVPFLEEDPDLVVRTLGIAAAHPSVAQVAAVAGTHTPTNLAVEAAARGLPGAPIDVIGQERVGDRRPGKGDAINTGFRYFLDRPQLDRIHFYDSEIRSFGADWIEKAEAAADLGYEAVRHYYPRAATDAMITWMVVRTGFALVWPDSELPWIQQPLSGELIYTRSAAEAMTSDPLVLSQSDWGIDTVLTFASVSHGLSIYECYISQGKDHALYGTLADIRTMMIECLAALQRLPRIHPPSPVVHRVEYPHAVSPSIAEKIGYDVQATQSLLSSGWSEGQVALLTDFFAPEIASGAKEWRNWPDSSFLDEDAWFSALRTMMDHFVFGDTDWEDLVFRLWVGRVLNYTMRVAVRGHPHSMAYLNDMITRAIASG